MAALQNMQEEICPSCGNFTSFLVEVTGFCQECSHYVGRCILCGQNNPGKHLLCRRHRRELWLTKNADAIERYMLLGLSFQDAKERVKKDNGTKYDCLCCGGHTKSNTIFCTKTAKCRAARERLRYMTNKKGVTHELALKTIMENL